MTTTKLRSLAKAKRFFGPIICVFFAWLFVRWATGIVAFTKLWPWCECDTPPPQTYVVAVIGAISFGVAPLWMLGAFVHLGWQWFNTPESGNEA